MSPRRGGRDGNVVVLVAAASMAFLGLLALVIDVGSWYGERARLQAVLDLAAREGMQAAWGASEGTADERVRARVRRVLLANGIQGETLELHLTGDASGGRLELAVARRLPRVFSTVAGKGDVSLLVRSAAAGRKGEPIRLVP